MLCNAQSVSISVQPSGQTPGVGDTFYLIIQTRNVSADPSPVNSMPGCKVLFPLQQRQVSQSSVTSGGRTTTSISASYAVTLRAETPGSYTFGPITVGGVRSNKVSYKIGAKSSAASGAAPDPNSQAAPTLQSADGGKLFLRATVSNSSPYEQQGVEYIVRLYTSYTSIFDWTAAASPKFGNCTYEASDAVSRSLSLADYGGRAYESAIIARYIIYPTQPGVAKILGNAYTGSVAQRFTYNDPYYGTMSRVQPRQIEARPNDIELNVRPLPPHEGTLSGVGDFKVSAALVSKQFKAHQPATVRYTISGTGNLGFLSLPDLKEIYPAELKFLKSDDATKKQVGASSVSGTVTFDCTIIPQREGEFEIPPVKFLFFNPEKGAYYTLQAEGFKITVGEGTAASGSEELVVFDDTFLPLGTLAKTHQLYISRPLIWLWFILPVVLLAVLMVIYRKRMAMLADTVGLRKRGAGKLARKRLRAAGDCLRRADASKFYEEMLKAMWGYLADKLSMPTSELSRDNVSERLTSVGVTAETVGSVIDLLDTCEFAKYGSTSGVDMKETYEAGCRIIDEIEQEIAKDKSESAPMRNTLTVLALLLFSMSAHAADAVTEAKKYCDAKDYTAAIAVMQEQLAQKGSSPELYFDLAGIYYKAGNFGASVLNYNRALQMRPDFKEARNNLKAVNADVHKLNESLCGDKNLDPAPATLGAIASVRNHISDAGSDFWLVCAIVAFLIGICAFVAYLLMRNVTVRKFGFFGAGGCILLSAICVVFSFLARDAQLSVDTCVLMQQEATLKVSPTVESKTAAAPIAGGTTLRILSSTKDKDGKEWVNLFLNNDYSGWLPVSEVEIITVSGLE